MILPDKHLSVERWLVSLGATVLEHLRQPRSVSALWESARQTPGMGTFHHFTLAVTLKGPVTALPVETKPHRKSGRPTLAVPAWNDLLGRLMFGLDSEETAPTFTPSFRSLIGYFIRRGAHAFSQPFEHFPKQQEWDKQVNTAHLLQLDWHHPHRWQLLREKKKLINQLKESAKSGIDPHSIGLDHIGDLEAARVNLEEKAREGATELASFKVHPQYRDLEIQASRITSDLHRLNNQNVSDREMLAFYETALHDETPAPSRDIDRLYSEAGIVLPGHVTQRLEDVHAFHARLIHNRRDFLQDALASLTSQSENFQYLCCLNSDRIPTSGFPKTFDWRNFVKLTLRDESADGELFGFRFGDGSGESR